MSAYPIPAWRVTLDGQDLTDKLAPRLVDLTITEARSEEADQLEIVIHDHDGLMAIPARGVMIEAAIGWRGTGLVHKGSFCVDEVTHSGAPDIITVRARSADLTQHMRARRERSWHDTTLGGVLRDLASDHGLEPAISAELDAINIPHLDQGNESDVALITKLGRRYDAVATVKNGALVFAPIGSGASASGLDLPRFTIRRGDGDQHRFAVTERDTYSGVRSFWTDKGNAQREAVLVGTDSNVKQLRETYATLQIAREQAEAEWRRLQRGAATLDYTLALGRAELSPEQHVTVAGFKSEIDGQEWLVVKATHTITGSSGYTTALQMERAIA